MGTLLSSTVLRIGSTLVVTCLRLAALAQNEDDALRSSTNTLGGTARSIGVANAFGALGADGAVISMNPAGLGLFRTSEISLTPGFEVNGVKSLYYGTSASDTKSRFYIGNMLLAINSPSQSGSNWRSSTFGVAYDRTATHHWARQAIGDRVGSSILDDLASQAAGILPDSLYNALPFTSGLAYDTYGINPNDTLGSSYSAALPDGADVRQIHTIDSRGANNTTSFFYSANWMDQVYIGLSLGLVGHRYTRTTTHTETTIDEAIDLKDVTYKEDLTTTGNGIDVKAGVIWRMSDRFRTGVAFHSPQWTQLNDEYVTLVSTNFRSADDQGRTSYSSTSPEGVFNYRVQTPWRTVLSAAYIAGGHGLVSVDYEYVDYGNARLKPSDKLVDPYDFAAENDVIKDRFRAVHSVRVGTEWRNGNWYFRAGWGFVPDPYEKSDPRHGQAQRTYAGGVGYRTDHLGIDLGMNYVQSSTNYYQYDPALVATTNEVRSTVRSLVTVSLRP